MAEKRPLTPERELLKLIEEPGIRVNASPTKTGRNLFSLFSPVVLKARFSFLKAKFKGGFNLQRLTPVEFRVINRSLELCIFISIFYLAASFIISMINLDRESSLAFEIKKITASSVLPETSLLKVASYYLRNPKARDIFKMEKSHVAETEQVQKASISKIAQGKKNLKLVGISWSDAPDAIIEDASLKRVYFLKSGQMINGFQVKAILKDKVILGFQGEEIELR
jgi:hypothetical protein